MSLLEPAGVGAERGGHPSREVQESVSPALPSVSTVSWMLWPGAHALSSGPCRTGVEGTPQPEQGRYKILYRREEHTSAHPIFPQPIPQRGGKHTDLPLFRGDLRTPEAPADMKPICKKVSTRQPKYCISTCAPHYFI